MDSGAFLSRSNYAVSSLRKQHRLRSFEDLSHESPTFPSEEPMKRYRHLVRQLCLICGLLVLPGIWGVTALGQTGTSSVRGTVTDQLGKVVSGATVTLTNTETNATRNQTTTDSGVYAFEQVPPGPYHT